MATIRYLSDGRCPYDLDSEDVELARLLWEESGKTLQDRTRIIKLFHATITSLSKSVAIVSCAIGDMCQCVAG